MPRRPDPYLEERILTAADALWRRGGEQALTMRAVARAARTNTPAVYRRFKNREDLIRGLLWRIASRIRKHIEEAGTLEQTAEAYIDYAVKMPNEYQLFYKYVRLMSLPKGRGAPRPIRETRPIFAFTEQSLAKHFGGTPADYTRAGLQLWGLLHGTAMLLVGRSIPEGHETALREACREGVRTLLESAAHKKS